jgi:hypothetical protein
LWPCWFESEQEGVDPCAHINAPVVPRAHLSLAGDFDRLTPPAGLGRIDAGLWMVYEAEDTLHASKLARYDMGFGNRRHARGGVVVSGAVVVIIPD